MARAVGAPTSGAKNTLSTAVFAEVSRCLEATSETDRMAEWYRCCACADGSSYREWLESPKPQTMTWWQAPSDELMAQHQPARAKVVSVVTTGTNAPEDRALSVNEYARLACILTQHEGAKQALLDSQLNLTRAQLDRSERRDDFWSHTIAPLFNSPDTAISFNPPIDLPEVNANAAPLGIRGGSRLMRAWSGTRSLFTVAYTNWSASGQNDPTNFSSFLPKAPGGGEEIPADARRAFVLFYVLRCGTENEDATVLDCVSRISKAPYDDIEETDPRFGFLERGSTEGSLGPSERKRRREEDTSVSTAFLEGAQCLAEAISTPRGDLTSPATSARGSATIMETTRLLEDYSRLLVLLRNAKSEAADNDYVKMLETQVRHAKDRIRHSQKIEEEMNAAR
jgi:hypothetical protein